MNATLIKDEAQRRALLSQILKTIRRVRGMRSAEVARAMGMKLRTYQHWEGGNEELNLDRIHAFAEATDADPYGIIVALDLGSVDFAVSCLVNKAATGVLVSLQRFNARAGKNLARLDPHSVVTVLDLAFDDLALRSRSFDAVFESWMTDPAITQDPDDLPPAGDDDPEDE